MISSTKVKFLLTNHGDTLVAKQSLANLIVEAENKAMERSSHAHEAILDVFKMLWPSLPPPAVIPGFNARLKG